MSRGIGLAVAVSLFGGVVDSASQPTPAPAASGIGAPAKDFDVKTLDGIPLRLESFRGTPLILNFFASWCDPCREEMPLVSALASEAGARGYRVIGIAVQDTRGAVEQYVKESGLAFPIALDLNSRVQRAYWVFGPPATFFIDAQGIVRDRILGPLSPDRARNGLERAGVRKGVSP